MILSALLERQKKQGESGNIENWNDDNTFSQDSFDQQENHDSEFEDGEV